MFDADGLNKQADDEVYPPSSLYDTALDYQRVCLELGVLQVSEPKSQYISALVSQRRKYADQLLELIEPTLIGIAKQWSDRSGMAHDMKRNPSYKTRHDIQCALAKSAFLDILNALTTLKIDPTGNLQSCLQTIAWRSLARQHSGIYCRHYRENEPWTASTNVVTDHDAIDHTSDELYERVITAMSAPPCLKAIYSYWMERLDVESWKVIIIWIRGIPPTMQEITNLNGESWNIMTTWLRDRPKLTSQEIAELMGPGWTDMQVRKRVHRILQDTKEFLQGHNYEEFSSLKEIRMDEYTITMLRTLEARQFWERNFKSVDQRIITLCIQQGKTLTYQEIAEKLLPKRQASNIRERANRVVNETRAHLQANGLIEPRADFKNVY